MLTIKVTAYNAQPLSQPLEASFGEAGGSIGRAPGNTLVLPDPDRVISRTHALVVQRDGAFFLRDQGSAVAVMVNGRPVGNGRECPLRPGDEILIAGFAMQVESSDARHPTSKGGPAPSQTGDRSFDPVATVPSLPAGMRSAPPSASPTSAQVLSWEEGGASSNDRRITTVILESPGPPQIGRGDDARPDAPSSEQFTRPPEPAESAEPPITSTTPAPPASREALLRAFLSGAGVPDLRINGGLTPELMHELGLLLREATQGLLDLLLARALTKREVHAEMTMIVAKDNNPLKFSPDLEAALTHLLAPKGRGFMAPLPAVRDAYDGLRSHQLGFMAGMHAALTAVLARFDPHQVERRLTQRTVADSLLPIHRKAKLWDLFGDLYGDISSQAQHDFNALFGREFLRAYQAEVAKLRDEAPNR